jgi:hypothetical protein
LGNLLAVSPPRTTANSLIRGIGVGRARLKIVEICLNLTMPAGQFGFERCQYIRKRYDAGASHRLKLVENGVYGVRPFASLDTTGHPYARAREMSTARAQTRFLACYQECGRVLMASRWAKVSRAVHYL